MEGVGGKTHRDYALLVRLIANWEEEAVLVLRGSSLDGPSAREEGLKKSKSRVQLQSLLYPGDVQVLQGEQIAAILRSRADDTLKSALDDSSGSSIFFARLNFFSCHRNYILCWAFLVRELGNNVSQEADRLQSVACRKMLADRASLFFWSL